MLQYLLVFFVSSFPGREQNGVERARNTHRVTLQKQDTNLSLGRCRGFGWDRVNFLQRELCDTLVWIFDDSSGDVLVAAEQLLHRDKDLFASHAALPATRLGVHQELGGSQPGQLAQTAQRDVPPHRHQAQQ